MYRSAHSFFTTPQPLDSKGMELFAKHGLRKAWEQVDWVALVAEHRSEGRARLTLELNIEAKEETVAEDHHRRDRRAGR